MHFFFINRQLTRSTLNRIRSDRNGPAEEKLATKQPKRSGHQSDVLRRKIKQKTETSFLSFRRGSEGQPTGFDEAGADDAG